MKSLIAIAACTALIVSTSCEKTKDDSPDLPPAASLNVDIASLTSAPAAAKNAPTTATAAPEDHLNFANAWVRVKIVQYFAGLVIVVPALSIAAALQQKPTKEGDQWHWSVTVNDATADLYVSASLVSGFDVELYMTNPELEDYLWVEGNFGDGTGSGEWILHDPMIEGADDSALSIQWTYVSDTDRALTYEVLSPRANGQGQVFEGDTFTYAIDGTTASLEYEDADDPGVVAIITWDTSSGTGSITVPGFNGGSEACWDNAFENIDC